MKNSDILIRPVVAEDAAGIALIYNHYVASTIITFEEDDVSADEMARRIEDVEAASLPWLVAEREGRVVGYAYATKWRARRGYRFSAEATVYVDEGCGGAGIGSRLYEALLPMLRAGGIHAVMGGIALPNDASVALHEKFGFVKVAHFEEVGFKFGKWIDVGYWQLILGGGDWR
ncbi:MAG TPA: arsinothricin resistance N-acetyltransferase ArsN1 family B [Thermoanaerobaculia bacterium]